MPILTLLSSADTSAGIGSVTVSVSALASSGNERIAGTASVALSVAGLSSTGSERITGSGAASVSVPSIAGSQTVASSGGGGGGSFTARIGRYVFEPPIRIIAGAGAARVSKPNTIGAGRPSTGGSAAVAVRIHAVAGSGTHKRPVITGFARTATAIAIQISGRGVHDITPVEEEEIMWLLAAA